MTQPAYYWILGEAPILQLGQKTVGSAATEPGDRGLQGAQRTATGVSALHPQVPVSLHEDVPLLSNAKEMVLLFINI